MTVRLYYADSYLTEFSAVAIEQCRLAEKPAVVLNQTVFYPTSGGQPFDTGVLGTARVLDVEEDPAGRVLHVLDSPLPLGSVRGTIDWERRFDHMQQHTGQHILSQAFVRLANAPTVSFHMGAETSTIDVELTQPSASIMQEVEELASRIVFEDRPVHALTVQPEELTALGVRKRSQREGEIRVIAVEDFDRSPCGGTHVRCSGEIGVISILGHERYKGGTRLEFVCGRRALKTLRKENEILRQLAKLYSGQFEDLPRLAENFFQDRSALLRENAKLQDKLLDREAGELALTGDRLPGLTLVRKTFAGRSLENIKILSQKIVSQGGTLAILGLVQGGAQVVVARSLDLSLDCGSVVKTVVSQYGGKGGGKAELAQAGGISPDRLEAWIQAFVNHVTR